MKRRWNLFVSSRIIFLEKITLSDVLDLNYEGGFHSLTPLNFTEVSFIYRLKVHNLIHHNTLVFQIKLAKAVKERNERKGQDIVRALNIRN